MKICQETIIILHGWDSSAKKWQAVKQGIEKQGIRVIVPDLPGFKQETELKKPWNLDDYVEWFRKFSEEACPEPARKFLLGHSFGGRIAIKFAAKYPERLKGLILVSSAGIKHKPSLINLIFSSGVKKVKFIFLKIPLLKNLFPVLRKIFYKYILRKTDYINAEKMPYLKETFKNIIQEDLFPYLSQIKIPTLIIWGEKDKITPVSDAYLMNKKIQNSKLEILKNIGHAPHLKTPEILAKKITNFIS